MIIKDADRRAVILQKFYDVRHERNDWLEMPVEASASEGERRIVYNICRQLSESGLINWKVFSGPDFNGAGRITNLGVDVIEGNVKSPIAITIDGRQISVHGSSHVQIGDGNAQNITFTADKIVAAINSSQVPPGEKEKAKSIVQSILESPLLSKLLGLVTA
jgi:hypothetical protein